MFQQRPGIGASLATRSRIVPSETVASARAFSRTEVSSACACLRDSALTTGCFSPGITQAGLVLSHFFLNLKIDCRRLLAGTVDHLTAVGQHLADRLVKEDVEDEDENPEVHYLYKKCQI